MLNFAAAAKEIEKQNASFGYRASKLEIANDIWVNYLSPSERLNIMNETGDYTPNNSLKKLRVCQKFIAERI